MITTTRFSIILLLGSAAVWPILSAAEDSPHWNKNTCETCHVEAAPVDGIVNLQAPDAEALCETCHGDRGDAKSCRHGSGLPVGNMTISENLRSYLNSGEVVCSTCHDIVYQCKHARIEYSFQNPGFLRDRTTRESGDYCLKCHDAAAYNALNPHEGVTGIPPKTTCSLCHAGIPESDGEGGVRVSFNMQHDLNDTCGGCHNVRPHPTKMFSYSKEDDNEWVHLVVPTAEVLAKMEQSGAETGITLPLNPMNGEIFCATCHNPHDFKVGGEHGSQSRGAKHRLRQENICQACHEK